MDEIFVRVDYLSTFVAFHFYFLLDLFQTAKRMLCSFFIVKPLQIPTSQCHRRRSH